MLAFCRVGNRDSLVRIKYTCSLDCFNIGFFMPCVSFFYLEKNVFKNKIIVDIQLIQELFYRAIGLLVCT